MSTYLSVGDCVLVNTETGSNIQLIGVIKYIGYIHQKINTMNSEYIGVELIEPIENGHNGTIDGYEYFKSPDCHGIHCQINDIVKKLSVTELMMNFKETLSFFKTKLSQYMTALNQRDKYIEKLKQKQNDLKLLLNQSTDSNKHKNKSNHSNKQKQQLQTVTKTTNVEKNYQSHTDVDKLHIKAYISDTNQTNTITKSISEINDRHTKNAFRNQSPVLKNQSPVLTSCNCTNIEPLPPIPSTQTYQSSSPIYYTHVQSTSYHNQHKTNQINQSPSLSPISPSQYQIISTHQSCMPIQQRRQINIQPQNHQNPVMMPQYVNYQTQTQQVTYQHGIPMYQPKIQRRSTN